MIFYKYKKTMIHLADEDIDFFNIVAGFLQEDTLALYLIILCPDYTLRPSIKENVSQLEKAGFSDRWMLPPQEKYAPQKLKQMQTTCVI